MATSLKTQIYEKGAKELSKVKKRYRWIQKRGDRIYAEIVVINLGTRKAYV